MIATKLPNSRVVRCVGQWWQNFEFALTHVFPWFELQLAMSVSYCTVNLLHSKRQSCTNTYSTSKCILYRLTWSLKDQNTGVYCIYHESLYILKKCEYAFAV